MTAYLTRLALTSVLSFAPLAGHAHGVWIEMQHGELAVVYGHGAEEDAYDPAKLTSIMVCPAGTACVAAATTARETHVTLPIPEAASVITAAFDNGYWSKDATGEWQNTSIDLVPGATEGGQYLKHVVHLTGQIPAGHEPMGLPLEIVPLADPFAMKAGDMLPVQVLMNGKPMAGAEITADYVNATDAAPISADADGKAMVPLRNQGLNVLSVSASEPHPEPAKAQEVGHTATLSFMLAHAGE
jgi:uncharacterized GH25 family protein